MPSFLKLGRVVFWHKPNASVNAPQKQKLGHRFQRSLLLSLLNDKCA